MPVSPDLYSVAFAATVLDPARDKPEMIAGPRGKAAVKRFNVYRNNVTHSLVSALADIFPATARVLGEGNFHAIARAFVRQEPPRSRLLFEYGHKFPHFLRSFEQIRHLVYLPDLARLERAWLDAYHAADSAPLAAEAIAALPPEELADARFAPHPATHIVASSYAIFSIFQANRSDVPKGRIRADTAETALVTRPHLTVLLRPLDAGMHAFLHELLQDGTLQQAACAASATDEAFDLSAAIGLLIESGAFKSVAAQPATTERVRGD